ncbi:MAG: hypothetical protein ACRDDY_19620 [Clostridium sp.]|uniref:hypothetical protein n=1 Tax=Clostridium sp. TaxID=1506 RepID=UPI003EE45D88
MDSGFILTMVVLTIIAIMCFSKGFSNIKDVNRINQDSGWYVGMLNKIDNEEEKNSCLTLGQSPINDYLVYTNSEHVYFVNQRNREFNKINKRDILNMEVEVYKYERNVKKLVALTSTFNKNVVIGDVVLKITTRQKVCNVYCMINGMDGFNRLFTNRMSPVDDANRIKLMIEDDVKNLKETNM